MLQIDYTAIGKRISTIRKKQKLSQNQLAEKADISNNYLSHIETSRSIPSLETLMSICSALDTTPDTLLLGTQKNNKSYLNDDITNILNSCTNEQKQLILDFAHLLIKNNYAAK